MSKTMDVFLKQFGAAHEKLQISCRLCKEYKECLEYGAIPKTYKETQEIVRAQNLTMAMERVVAIMDEAVAMYGKEVMDEQR